MFVLVFHYSILFVQNYCIDFLNGAPYFSASVRFEFCFIHKTSILRSYCLIFEHYIIINILGYTLLRPSKTFLICRLTAKNSSVLGREFYFI
jgi:hypothetical protein